MKHTNKKKIWNLQNKKKHPLKNNRRKKRKEENTLKRRKENYQENGSNVVGSGGGILQNVAILIYVGDKFQVIHIAPYTTFCTITKIIILFLYKKILKKVDIICS